MFAKLKKMKQRFHELKKELESEEVLKNPNRFKEVNKELIQIEKLVQLVNEYESHEKDLAGSQILLKEEKNAELVALAKEDVEEKENKLEELKEKLKIELLPKDPNDTKNVILEIRSGAGGDEASLFAQQLFEAYRYYVLKQNWKIEVISVSLGNVGGYKEVIVNIRGKGAYSTLKYESGVHRVQRIPKTESQGRVHTSTVTVVVLPEVNPVEVRLSPEDLRIDVCRASGAGGQHVNTTDSAVRIVHLPTKIMVYCQQEKSQHANKERALKILTARLWSYQEEKIQAKESQKRKEQMRGGDRSQRIRTYNFPQSRLTDHRIGFSQKNLEGLMEGDFEKLFQALAHYYQMLRLNEESD